MSKSLNLSTKFDSTGPLNMSASLPRFLYAVCFSQIFSQVPCDELKNYGLYRINCFTFCGLFLAIKINSLTSFSVGENVCCFR